MRQKWEGKTGLNPCFYFLKCKKYFYFVLIILMIDYKIFFKLANKTFSKPVYFFTNCLYQSERVCDKGRMRCYLACFLRKNWICKGAVRGLTSREARPLKGLISVKL